MSRQQRKTLSLFDEADFAADRVKPERKRGGLGDAPAQTEQTTREPLVCDLLGQVVASPNMRAALKRVERNKGAAGSDGMTVKQLRPFLLRQWPSLKTALLEGTYRPPPVKRVEIPRSAAGTRSLGIPPVADRLVQQALLQVLTPLFDPHFSPHSYGFRSGKRGHDAVRAASSPSADVSVETVEADTHARSRTARPGPPRTRCPGSGRLPQILPALLLYRKP